jgi:two-component system, OmpR family, sensor kinase
VAKSSLKTRLILTNTLIVSVLLVGGAYATLKASEAASLRMLDNGLLNRARELSASPVPMLERPINLPDEGPGGPGGIDERGTQNTGPNSDGQGGQPPWQRQGAQGRGNGLGRGQNGGGPGGGRRPRGPGPDFGRPVWILTSGQVLGPPGRREAWSDVQFKDALTGKELVATVEKDEGPLRVASVPIRRDGKIIGVVQAVQPVEGLTVASAAGQQVLLWVLPLGLLASGLAGWLVLRTSLAPVERATETASKIAKTGALNERLPVAGTDEMSRLSEAFNGMLETIAASQAEKDQAYARMEEALEDQKRFTADASHELRTPLSSIRLAIESLRKSDSLAPDAQRQLSLMDGASKGMARLVDDLLTLARADSGSLRVNREALDLKKPLAEALLVKGLGDSERLTVVFPDEALVGIGDEDAVRRIAVNLLANALRHCPEGQLEIGGRVEGGRTLFWVKDEGEGMTPEDALQAGTRFFRADSARNRGTGGHGLGLAICRSLVEAMGGGFRLTSELGRGTLVEVWLPKG